MAKRDPFGVARFAGTLRSGSLTRVLLVFLLLTAAGTARATKIFKWVDATGQLNVGTSPPPAEYQWVDANGRYYNRPVFEGKELTYLGPIVVEGKKVQTRGPLKRSSGYGTGKANAWETSPLKSAQPTQVSFGDQFLPIAATGGTPIVGLTGTVDKGTGCLSLELDNRSDVTLTEVRATLTLYTSNVFMGERGVVFPEAHKGTTTAKTCEGEGKTGFADGMALDRMTWKAGGEQKDWPGAGAGPATAP